MAYEERQAEAGTPHSLRLDERQRLVMTGVREVVSFDEEEVTVQSVKGVIVVRGSGLKVEKLEKQAGELTITGLVTELRYEERAAGGGGLWSRLFR